MVGQHRSHELGRVVGAQEGRLEGEHRVARRVGLDEGIARKRTDHRPHGFDAPGIDALGGGAFEEGAAILLETRVRVLLGQDLADAVGLRGRKARQGDGGLGHVLLVAEDAETFVEEPLEQGVEGLPGLAVEAVDVLVDVPVRRGADDGGMDHEVLEVAPPRLGLEDAHGRALDIEDAHGVAAGEEGHRGGIVEGAP